MAKRQHQFLIVNFKRVLRGKSVFAASFNLVRSLMYSAHILRNGPTGVTDVPVQLRKIQQAKSPDIVMQPDDILVIPSSAGKILAGRTLEAAIQAATLVSVAAF